MRDDFDRRDEPITSSRPRSGQSGALAGIPQPLPNPEDGRLDAGIHVGKDIGGPQALGDLFA